MGEWESRGGGTQFAPQPARVVRQALPEAVYVREADGLAPALAAVGAAPRVGVDLETTGLSPRADRVRLVSVATPAGTWVVDAARCDVGPLLAALEGKPLVFHHGKFDLGFLMRLGFQPGAETADTMLLSQLLGAGLPAPKGTHTLAGVARRALGLDLPKELQRSDWSGALSPAQIQYAGRDASVLLPLHDALMGEAAKAGIERAAAIEFGALPAVVWMGLAGVPFDREAWLAVDARARAEKAGIEADLNALAPAPPGLDLGVPWHWGNPQIERRVLAAVGIQVTSTADEVLAGQDHPLVTLLRRHRKVTQRVRSFGEGWPCSFEEGRLYPEWQQVGAEATGRMSCAKPNVQQVPRAREYRDCIAAPPGRVLVAADYSQIELRIAARLAGERRMLRAYTEGVDLHTLSAGTMLRKPLEQVTPEDRQIAKSANFGLLYGMGAPAYQAFARTNYGVDLTLEEAVRLREAFFEAYPGLRVWHRRVREQHAAEVRTLTGRRRRMLPADPDTKRLNTPVQGTGADGLKRALGLLWARRHACPGAVPVIACHDEIVVECPAESGAAAAAWVRAAMEEGMADLVAPVPVVVEPAVGERWGK